jgi:hypothetical protein
MTAPVTAMNEAMNAARTLNAALRSTCGAQDMGVVIPAVAALLGEAMRIAKMPEEDVEFLLAQIRLEVLGTDSPSVKFAPVAAPKRPTIIMP